MKRAYAVLLALCGCSHEYVVWRGHAPDRATDVRVIERGGSQRLLVGGVAQEAHRAVGVDAIAMSAGHLAYGVSDGAGWSIVRDGKAATSRWDAIGDVVLSADGAHLAYAAAHGPTWQLVLDEVPGPGFSAIDRGSVAFDRAGNAVYVGWRDEKAYVVRGASVGRAWDTVHDLRADGAVVYVAREGTKERVVRDALVSDAYDAIDELADDGFVAREGPSSVALVHAKKVAAGAIHGLVIAGRSYALALRQGSTEVVFRDGAIASEPWDKIAELSLSPGGERAAWIGERDKRATVVIEGVAQGTWAWARALRLPSRGGFAFVGSMGGGAVVVTHRGQTAFDVVIEDSLVLTDDGDHWACVVGYASVRKTYIAIDGRPRVKFDLGEWTDSAAQNAGRGTPQRTAQLQAWVRAELGQALAASGTKIK